MVPQKIGFKKKIFEKVANSCKTPPLVSELRDLQKLLPPQVSDFKNKLVEGLRP